MPASRSASRASSWNRASHSDIADADGNDRPRPRRNRRFIPRRSRRVNNPFSTCRRRRVKPSSASRRSRSSTRSPPERLSTIKARIICQDHLKVQPALIARRTDVTPNRPGQAADPNQVEVHPKTRQRRHSAARLLRFVLERKNPLCHPTCTPLVMVSIRKHIMNPFGFNANGGTSSLIDRESGESLPSTAVRQLNLGNLAFSQTHLDRFFVTETHRVRVRPLSCSKPTFDTRRQLSA